MRVLAVLLVALAVSAAHATPLAAGTAADDRSVREIAREISKLRDEVDPEVFAELASIGDKKSFKALAKALKSLTDDAVREAAYRAFHLYAEDPELGPESRSFLAEETQRAKQPAWRAASLRALLLWGEDALPDLDPLASGHRDAACRTIITDLLLLRLDARGDDEGLRTILENASLAQDAGVAYLGVDEARKAAAANKTHRAVVRALLAARLDGSTLPLFAERLASERASRVWKLVLLRLVDARESDDATAVLAATCLDDDPQSALLAVDLLVRRDGSDAREPTLRELLSSREPSLRRAAVIGLGELLAKDPGFAAEALELAPSKDMATRMGAAGALASVRTPEALASLHALAADREWQVRVEALRRISQWRDRSSIPVLVERFAAETGRMTEDVRAALVRVTRIDLGRNPERWADWWASEGDGFEVPPPDAREVKTQGREPVEGQSVARTFYKIRVLSERVAFVLDISGSMRTRSERSVGTLEVTRMDVAKDELTNVLRNLPDGTLFNVVFFETEIKPLERKLVEMKASTRARALRFVNDQYAVGATALYPALELAYDDPLVDTIYLLSDGAPTVGDLTDIEEIRAEVARWNATRNVRIHGIAMGQDSTLLHWLCDDTGGTYSRVD
ncbi:MAG: HEAT repeat domain-containing protein [Planctomycetota bacterium]